MGGRKFVAESRENNKSKTAREEELVLLAQQGDSNAWNTIIAAYQGLVRSKARSYFIVGGDDDDIVQEGMIGLYEAVKDYDPEKHIPFGAFAEMCIVRQIMTAIKAATRQKHIPLNSYVSLNKPVDDEENRGAPVEEQIVFPVEDDPEQLFIHKEEQENMTSLIGKELSPLESRVLTLYLEGKSYQDISHMLHKPVKSIDNALQRVKRKLGRSLGGG